MSLLHVHSEHVNGREKKCIPEISVCDLLESVLESTTNGVLVVTLHGKILYHNWNFIKLWGIPSNMANCADDKDLLEYVMDQLVDPESFLEGVEARYADPVPGLFDYLYFKNGRIYERVFVPLVIKGNIVGYIWSFTDVTKTKALEDSLVEVKQELAICKVQQMFTKREFQIVPLLVKGCTSAAISDALFISKKTVDFHRANIMRKVGAANIAELINGLPNIS